MSPSEPPILYQYVTPPDSQSSKSRWRNSTLASSITSVETYHKADELMDIFRLAVREAQVDSHRRGVSNVYYFDGTRYYELPSGEMTQSPQLGRQTDGAEQPDAAES